MTTNRLERALSETRGNLRVKENKKVLWQGKNGDSGGRAKVRNISLSGMLLESNSVVLPEDNQFSFESLSEQNGYIPKTGCLVWQRKKPMARNTYFYGIKFDEQNEEILDGLRQRVQQGIKQFTTRRKWAAVINVFFIIGIIGLTAYSLWMSAKIYQDLQASNQNMMEVSVEQAALARSYDAYQQRTEVQLFAVTDELTTVRQELSKTRQLYEEGQGMLQGVSKELAAANAALTETEGLLAQSQEKLALANQNNVNLTQEMEALKQLNIQQMAEMKAEMEIKIQSLQDKNVKLMGEMSTLQGQLEYYAGDVSNMEEGKTLVKLYRSRMKLVKSKIKHFKQEVHEVRKTAMQERDRVRSILGNNGYFMKNGETVKVDEAKYQKAVLDAPVSAQESQPQLDRKVEIDVTFFK